MWKKTYGMVIILLTVANLVALGFWLTRKYRHPPPPPIATPFPGPMMRQQLDLSREQAQQLRDTRQEFRQTTDRFGEQTREASIALLHELLREQPRREELDRLIDEINQAHNHLQRELVEHLLKHKQILSPEQQEKFFRMMLARLTEGPRRHRMQRMKPNFRRR